VKVSLAQLSPEADLERDCETACSVVRSRQGSDLVLFPELFLGGYSTEDPRAVATTLEGAGMRSIAAACAESGTAAIVGFTEDGGEGDFANSAACFDADGKAVAAYRKTNLFGPGERSAFVAGDSMTVVRMAGLPIGPQICFDMEFPEPSRLMALAGAEILATIAANMEPYAGDHRLAARARALDNRLPHLYANRVGAQSGHEFTGESCVIAPDGTVMAELDHEEGILDFEIEPTRPGRETSYLELLRSDLDVIVNDNGGEA
jgi:predicted amidohydrolase